MGKNGGKLNLTGQAKDDAQLTAILVEYLLQILQNALEKIDANIKRTKDEMFRCKFMVVNRPQTQNQPSHASQHLSPPSLPATKISSRQKVEQKS